MLQNLKFRLLMSSAFNRLPRCLKKPTGVLGDKNRNLSPSLSTLWLTLFIASGAFGKASLFHFILLLQDKQQGLSSRLFFICLRIEILIRKNFVK